jgi:hypothetical protein
MGAREPWLYAVSLHGPKGHGVREGFIGVSIHHSQVIGDVEGASVKSNMTVGTQAQDVSIDVRAAPFTA